MTLPKCEISGKFSLGEFGAIVFEGFRTDVEGNRRPGRFVSFEDYRSLANRYKDLVDADTM